MRKEIILLLIGGLMGFAIALFVFWLINYTNDAKVKKRTFIKTKLEKLKFNKPDIEKLEFNKTTKGIVKFSSECSASFSKIWIKHNVVKNGVKGIEFHFSASFYNAQNRSVYVIASIDSKKGVGVSDRNNQYRLGNGVVGTSTKILIDSNPAYCDDASLWMPVKELHIPPGKNAVWYVHLAVMVDKDPIQEFDLKKVLCWSDFESFSVSGRRKNKDFVSDYNFNYESNINPVNSGALDILSTQTNIDGGSSNSASKRRCPTCSGTGKGMDEIIWVPNYTGEDNSRYCSECGQTTSAHYHRRSMCRTCYGKGYI